MYYQSITRLLITRLKLAFAFSASHIYTPAILPVPVQCLNGAWKSHGKSFFPYGIFFAKPSSASHDYRREYSRDGANPPSIFSKYCNGVWRYCLLSSRPGTRLLIESSELH